MIIEFRECGESVGAKWVKVAGLLGKKIVDMGFDAVKM